MTFKFLSLGTVVYIVATFTLWAVEPWADSNLPVKDELELWLDASQENTARSHYVLASSSVSNRPLTNDQSVSLWHDLSGQQRHVRQPLASARPRFVMTSNGDAVRFDGKDDFLAVSAMDSYIQRSTIFIRAIPRSNHGGFRALLAFNREGINDYISGLTIDLGPFNSTEFNCLNVEGRGFGGPRDLLTNTFSFEGTYTITVLINRGKVRTWADGVSQGQRDSLDDVLSFDEFTLGARFYSNSSEPPFVQGYFDGDIAEVIIYGRALTDSERAQVETYLAAKNGKQNSKTLKPASFQIAP